MRKLTFALAALFTVSAFAQVSTIEKRFADKEHDHGMHAADGMIKTVDPFGNEVGIYIDPPAINVQPEPWYDSKSPMFIGYNEVDESIKFPENKAVVTVDVHIVADEEYRAAHSDWVNRTSQIVEIADNGFYRDHQINFIVRGHYSWTSNGGSASAILSDLVNDAGSTFSRGLVIGFTDDSNFNAGGIAYVYSSNPGVGFAVNLDQGVSSTAKAAQHEAGHNYSCSHDFDPVVCIMNYTYSYQVDYWDVLHDNEINAHRNWFR